jgi:hypothetical protein
MMFDFLDAIELYTNVSLLSPICDGEFQYRLPKAISIQSLIPRVASLGQWLSCSLTAAMPDSFFLLVVVLVPILVLFSCDARR